MTDVLSPGVGPVHMIYPYADPEQYLDGTIAYIEQARAADAAVVIVTPQERRAQLSSRLGPDDSVKFMDTASVTRSPRLLLPMWQEWIDHQADGRPVHGINDTSWPTRGAAYDDETRYAEWLINRAFSKSPAWSLLCPVDTTLQSAPAIEALTRCHPLVWSGTAQTASAEYASDFYTCEQLVQPSATAEHLTYRIEDLAAVREMTGGWAARIGLSAKRTAELILAVNELATNSIRYGGGSGTLLVWVQDNSIVCEVRDAGTITDPLAGRLRPSPRQLGGRGLWYVYQIGDLVQLRSTPEDGTRIQLWVDLPTHNGG